MKAIILLQEFRKIKVGNDFVGYQELKEEVQSKINEAIKELEELENRSCSNCNNFQIFNSKVVRDSCCVLNVSDIGGCGDYFEPKKG